ncbi:asparagine synthase (glutamine-hydrolyzing) [Psychroserpens burtonensis]|uniref:asparagine synthase (glutamine-hydrolyzing) n=1 Tax=Psychroserpens burtonensis TaxID=49278 RepID=A0A5C7BCT4_9FLAO|nr:asparagine synthase (glutamine-hydrolyzing) [Psychroserpens burtonensis]TXE20244.1 asparagine synthase (glutamine-hydrolyzing) [Psychroserpens burtonensis]
MCGIYGSTLTYNESQVKDKLKRTAFRGPDKMGWQFYKQNNHQIIFGHNRLSIIDLDLRSDQPFTYHEYIHVVFNGEIYNFKSIKDTLEKKGYQFRTTSDTEVLCAAYLEYAQDCVEHLNGMFAFVIYDEKKQLFFGARDRLGQKPFYYYHDGKDFEFASQISSIQLHHDNLTVSERSISYYLAWGHIPDPLSIFNEVKKLKAGHTFTFDLNTCEFQSQPYWDIDYKNEKPFKGSYEDAKQELNEILKDAVSTRLFADVPVGVFLSGGIDSSLIAATATQTSTSKIKTFSVKFNEKGFDESQYAQKVANHLGTDHHIIECNNDEGIDLIENFCHYYDEPFSDSSAIPSMLLSKYTKKHVTVALSGDAGDESFLGYHRYNWTLKKSGIYKLPKSVRKLSATALSKMPNYKLKVISKALRYSDENDFYLSIMTGVDLSYIRTSYDYHDIDELKYLRHNHKNVVERISDFDTKTYLNWDINTKVDRATMAFSLEARSPFLDHRVVDFANALPTEFKMQDNNQKRILKDILYQSVPKQFFDRPKAGFTMPFERWFRADLKEYVLSELNDEALKSIPCIDIKKVQFMIEQHMDGSWNRYPLIWKLLVLKQWLNTNGKGLSVV